MSPGELALAAGIIAAACALQGAIGFGANLVAAPLLVLIDPVLVPGPLIGVATLLTLLMFLREPERAANRHVLLALAGRVPGNVLGVAALALVPEESLSLMVGAVVLLAVVMSASGLHVAPTDSTVLLAGGLSGLMGTATSVGGPPMALLYQHESGPRLRGTLAVLLLAGSVLSLATLLAAGQFGGDEAVATAALLPGVVVGFAFSRPIARILDRGHTRRAVLVLSAASAALAMASALR